MLRAVRDIVEEHFARDIDAPPKTDAERIQLLRHTCAADFCEREPKACGCGRKYRGTAWLLLPFVGWSVDDVAVLELRNCTCRRSTLAVPVPA